MESERSTPSQINELKALTMPRVWPISGGALFRHQIVVTLASLYPLSSWSGGRRSVVPSINSVRRRNPGILSVPATGFAGAPKDVQLMTRRDDLELSHGATAKVRENAVKQDRVRVTNAFGHHPERSGFLRRTEFIGGTGYMTASSTAVSSQFLPCNIGGVHT